MKILRIAVKECNYQELDRWVKEQFIHDINDDSMLIEINSELKLMKNKSKVTNNLVLMWERQVEAWMT